MTSKVHFQHFLDLLHSNNVKRRTVEAYASELCISPKYLTVVCKKNSGKTANEWITEHVLEDIRYYLRQTDLSIKQICDKLAFPNTSFFGKYVKDHFGVTPLEFRNG
jgi:AraC-like DNA-binding protein